MYNIPPNTHTCFLCYTMLTTSTAGNTHAHTHTAYYLYEVLYTSDHQHRVSVFSNPHSGWIGRSMQWKDYTDGLMGVLIWVIVSALVNKNRCRKEYHCLYTIVLNVLQLYILSTVFTVITHSHCESVLVLSEWSWTEQYGSLVKLKLSSTTTVVTFITIATVLGLGKCCHVK